MKASSEWYGRPPESNEVLETARAAFRARAWQDAATHFSAADATGPLSTEDRERWAAAAGLSGDDLTMVAQNERLYRELQGTDNERAARAAFWAGYRLLGLDEAARARAWFSRAQRLVDALGGETAVAGYLELPVVAEKLRAQALSDALAAAQRAAQRGELHRDADLVALARQLEARTQLRRERTGEALALLDEVMLAASGGELSPVVTGLVYCGAIAACRSVYAFDRAREWTRALSDWCQSQPQLAPFRGSCAVFRAELFELAGAFDDAIAELGKQSEYALRTERASVAEARYREGEVHRLRGDSGRAEAAYRAALELGADPLPGYALLRAAQGHVDAALGSLRRALSALTDPLARVRMLPALVALTLDLQQTDEARAACAELRAVADRYQSPALDALRDDAEAALSLAEGAAADALPRLRAALDTWQRLEAPYHAAKTREAIARACSALGDQDGANFEREAARSALARLGVVRAPPQVSSRAEHGLSARELEVLRLVATGKSNKEIATALTLSVKTVDRHVSNLLGKLGVSSRTAAAAFAFERRLLGNSTH